MTLTSGAAVPVPAGGFSAKAAKSPPLIGIFVDCDEDLGMLTAYSQDNCGQIKAIFSWSKENGLTEERVCELIEEKMRLPVLYDAGQMVPQGAPDVEVCLTDQTRRTLKEGEEIPANIGGKVMFDSISGKSAFVQNPVKDYVPVQIVYNASETFPLDAKTTVTVCKTDDQWIELTQGAVIPADMDGFIHVDPSTRQPVFYRKAAKDLPPVILLQTMYKAADNLPADADNIIEVMDTDGEVYTVKAGDELPVKLNGYVAYDMVTKCIAWAPQADVRKQLVFCAGDTLPEYSACPVTVCLTDGSIVDVQPNTEVPADIDGAIFVDPLKCQPQFLQTAIKDTGDTFADPFFAAVAGNDFYGTAYAIGDKMVRYPNGKVIRIAEQVIDTDTDTWATGGIAPSDGVDMFGVDFEAGNPVVTFADGQVMCVPAKVTDTNDYSMPLFAPSAGTDIFGVDYIAGAKIVRWPNGMTMCVPDKVTDTDTDTASEPVVAAVAGVDAFGIAYGAGDKLIVFPDGRRVCIPAKVVDTDTDTAAVPMFAANAGTDIYGVDYVAGAQIILFANGNIACVPDKNVDTDTFGTVELAAAAGVDSLGVPYANGDKLVVFPNGVTLCVPDKVVDTDTAAVPMFAANAGTDIYGVEYVAGAQIILFGNGNIACVPEKSVDTDTFGTVELAAAAGVDSLGVPYANGDKLVVFPNGVTLCVPDKVVDTDTAAVPMFAASAGTDFYGQDYVTGDKLIVFPDGSVTKVIEATVDTDTAAVPIFATIGGNDFYGESYSAGDKLILFGNGNLARMPIETVDTFAVSGFAPSAGSDAFSRDYAAGDGLITLSDGSVVCIPNKIVDTDTYSVPSFATQAGTDVYGKAYAVGARIITYAGGEVVCVPPAIPDTFGTTDFAQFDGVDALGRAYQAGARLVSFPDGRDIVIPEQIVDTDTFGEPVTATVAGTDTFGQSFAIGDKLIVFPDGKLIRLAEQIVDTDTDTWGTPMLATTAGTDAYGTAFAIGDKVIVFPDGMTVCVPSKTPSFAAVIVDYDEAVHGAYGDGEAPAVGAGTVASPLQIIRPNSNLGNSLEFACRGNSLELKTTNLQTGETSNYLSNSSFSRSSLFALPVVVVRGSDGWQSGDVVASVDMPYEVPECGARSLILFSGGYEVRVNSDEVSSFGFDYYFIDSNGFESRAFYGGATGTNNLRDVILFNESSVSGHAADPWPVVGQLAQAGTQTPRFEARIGTNILPPEAVVQLNRTDISIFTPNTVCCEDLDNDGVID